MSLRDRISAKQRRTATWPLLVGNPAAAAAEVETFRKALAAHEAVQGERKKAGKRPTKADRERGEQLRADLTAALQRAADTVVMVELQSLPDDEWEALFGPIEPDEDGDYDLREIHAVMLAASCTDPELQDAQWWEQELSGPQWTAGDRSTLSRVLLELNVYAPRFDALGKG